MKRLYVRLFTAFWVISGLITLMALIYEDKGTNRSRAIINPASTPNSVAQRLSDDLLSSIVGHDLVSLTTAMEDDSHGFLQFVYVLDEDNEDLLHRTLPEPLLPMVAELNEEQRLVQRGNNIARNVTLADGSQVKAITHVESPLQAYLSVYLLHFAPWVLLGVLASGVSCFWFVRNISRDLTTLKAATQQIAQGNLQARLATEQSFRCEEFYALGQDFDHMADRLEHTMLRQKRIVKEVSHELRAPISRIDVALELARAHTLPPVVRKALESIETSSEDLRQTISNILAMPIDDREVFELTDTIELNSFMQEVVDRNQPLARLKNIVIQVQWSKQELLVQTRNNVLTSVFDNIVRNAINYSGNESRIVIELQLPENNDAVQVVIRDQGPGVPEAELAKIFQPFYRIENSRSVNAGGCGLGLAIAQHTVALHQGTINAVNLAEGGLAVTVTLPLLPGQLFDLPTEAVITV